MKLVLETRKKLFEMQKKLLLQQQSQETREKLIEMQKKLLLRQQAQAIINNDKIEPDDMIDILRRAENNEGDIDELIDQTNEKKKLQKLEEMLAKYNEKKTMLDLAPNDKNIKEEVEFWKSELIKEFGFGV